MNQTFISLSSLPMDLKRVAIGYHRGSIKMGNRFLEEAMSRRAEVDKSKVKPYVRKLTKNLDKLVKEKDLKKRGEDALMYNVLFQNASIDL